MQKRLFGNATGVAAFTLTAPAQPRAGGAAACVCNSAPAQGYGYATGQFNNPAT